MMRFGTVPIILVAALLSMPYAGAGSAEDPEVTDGTDDAFVLPEVGALPVPMPFLDVTAAWFEDTDADTFTVHLAIVEAPPAPGVMGGEETPVGCAQVGVAFSYYVEFNSYDSAGKPIPFTVPAGAPKETSHVAATIACSTAGSVSGSFWEFYHGYSFTDLTGGKTANVEQIDGSIEGNVISWIVPKNIDHIGIPAGAAGAGYSLRETSAHSGHVTRAVAGVVFTDDLAPDSGYGRDFYFEAGGASETTSGPIFVDLETAFLSHSWVTPTNDTYIFNWTSESTELDAGYKAAVTNGTVALTVTDPAGTEQINQTLTADAEQSFSWTDLPTGNWTIQVAYTNFTGNFSFSMSEPQPEETSTGTSTGTTTSTGTGTSTQTQTQTTGTTTQTETEEDGGKQTPGLGLVPLLGFLGAALVVAHRRL